MMATSLSKNSRSVVRSGVFKGDKELVVAAGYNETGKYGYFICWEQATPDGYEYSSFCFFKAKESEQTYQQVLRQLNNLVEAYKT